MKVLGVSGSPIKNSNTDRALKAALDATGMETEFIKLTEYNVAPCIACLGCVDTNVCIQKDDGIMLAEKAKEADAMIVAGYTPYSSLDARTKAFIERLYPLRHQKGVMRNKPGGIIVTCAVPNGHTMLPSACENGINAISYYMMEEGMEIVGKVAILGNAPCVRCHAFPNCEMSGLRMIFGPEATLESVGIHKFEDQPDAIDAASELGKKIAAAVRTRRM